MTPDGRLPAVFFDRDPSVVARDLLGCVVIRDAPEGIVSIRLVEVEAYGGLNDPGSHARHGRTARNAAMLMLC